MANYEKTNNPAGKLRELLEEGSKRPGNQPTWKIWADILHIEASKPHDLYKGLIHLADMVTCIERMITNHAASKQELLLEYIPRLRLLTTPKNLEISWETYRTKITPDLLLSLRYTDHELRPFAPPDDFVDSLQRIKRILAEVQSDIYSGNLPQNVKDDLTNKIESALASIEDFQLFGINRIAEAVDTATGALVWNSEAIKNDTKRGEWFGKFTNALLDLNRWVRAADAAGQLGKTILKAIDN